MNYKCFFPLFILAFLSISATTKTELEPTAGIKPTDEKVESVQYFKKKFTYLERVVLKFVAKKILRVNEPTRADKKAKAALTLGIISAALLLAGVFIPYIILACIPPAILAMIFGKQALKNDTSLPGKANTGRILGLVTIITLLVLTALLFLFIALYIAMWGGFFGGG